MKEFLKKAKASALTIATLDGKTKNRILNEMADSLVINTKLIVTENKKDMEAGKKSNLDASLLDRLLLDEIRVASIAQSLREIAALKEPVGRVLEGWVNDDNLRIEKIRKTSSDGLR